jgi:hypothetical protein
MDQRIESFLADVLALAGEEPDAIFRAQEPNRRMRDRAALACPALCRAVEERR